MNKVTLVIGKRGTGKTTEILKIIKEYERLGRNLLLMDTLNNESYSEIKTFFNNEKLKKWNGTGVYRCITNAPFEAFEIVENKITNCFVIFEDATRFFDGGRLTPEIKRYIYDTKQKNVDLAFVFHGFGSTPPELFRSGADCVIMFKSDNPECRKRYINNYDEIQKAFNKISSSSNPYIKLKVDIH